MDLISWIDLNETIFVYLALSFLRIFSILSFCFFSLSHDGRAINISTEYSIAIMVLFLENFIQNFFSQNTKSSK